MRAAVIGTGAISAQHLAFLSSSPRANLVGVCDLSPVSAKVAARRHDAGGSFTDAAAMLDIVNADVVHILTPPNSHGFLARMALDHGAHVICEKPMTATSDEAVALLNHASLAKRHLVENHNYRFNDDVVTMHDNRVAGTIGTVREVEIRMALPVRDPKGRFADENLPNAIHKMPAGVIHDVLTHMVYLLDHLSDHATWDTVSATWSNHGGGDLFKVDDLDTVLVGHHANGSVHGRLRFSAQTSPDSFGIIVRGSEGQMSTDLFHPFLDIRKARAVGSQLTPIANHVVNGASLARAGFRNFGQKLLQHSPYHGLARFLDETYTAFAAGTTPPVTPRDIITAAQLIDRMVGQMRLTQGATQ